MTYFLPFLFSLHFTANLLSQSNIQQSLSVNSTGAAAHSSAALDVSATDKGMLVPRMTTAQRTAIASPAIGLLVYDTDTKSFWYYNITAWVNISPQTVLADTDGDTKIQVEKILNENIVRIDLAGTEHLVLRRNAHGNVLMEFPNNGNNVFLGNNAGSVNTALINTFVGNASGQANTTGSSNAFFGQGTGTANTTGSRNSIFGANAGLSITTATDNSFFGYLCGSSTTSSQNAFFGSWAGTSNTIGTSNSFFGATSGDSNTTGSNNSFFGHNSGGTNSTGAANSFFGSGAGLGNTTGNSNSFYGSASGGTNTTGAQNAFFGASSGLSSTTASNNSFFGFVSGGNNTTGAGNVFFGSFAGSSNTTAHNNAFFGTSSGTNNTTGTRNTLLGTNAGASSTTANDNVLVGYNAGTSNTTGNNNTALGSSANVSSGGLSNATVIGYNATVNASNKVRIGNGSVTVIEGQVDWTFPSDARFKFNVHDDDVPGLAFIEKLRPVTYQFDTRKFDEHVMQNMPDSIQRQRLAGQDYSKSTAIVQTGFLAQEVEEVCKKLDYEFSGLHVPESEVDNYGLAYGSFVPLLVKAVQEQQQEIEKLKKLEIENAALKSELQDYKSQLGKITAALAGAGIVVEK